MTLAVVSAELRRASIVGRSNGVLEMFGSGRPLELDFCEAFELYTVIEVSDDSATIHLK